MLEVTVHGGEEDAAETYRELMQSLAHHHGKAAPVGDIVVDAPDAQMLAKALRVLSRPSLQRQIMDQLLSSFGKKLIEPLGAVLDPSPQGSLMASLVLVRSSIMSQVARLAVTRETRQLLSGDIEKLLNDDYLEMLAENEERVQQPRVQKLAQATLKLLGDVFYAALQRWPDHAEQIALMVSRRMERRISFRKLPNVLRDQVIAGIEEFLWVETSSEIEGALGPLYASHRDIAATPPTLERAMYTELAEGCWRLVSSEG